MLLIRGLISLTLEIMSWFPVHWFSMQTLARVFCMANFTTMITSGLFFFVEPIWYYFVTHKIEAHVWPIFRNWPKLPMLLRKNSFFVQLVEAQSWPIGPFDPCISSMLKSLLIFERLHNLSESTLYSKIFLSRSPLVIKPESALVVIELVSSSSFILYLTQSHVHSHLSLLCNSSSCHRITIFM